VLVKDDIDIIQEKYLRTSISLLQFVEHECNHEYEKAKRSIFDTNKKVFEDTTYNEKEGKQPTQFH
jgi:hypothetical protein